ncbi:hypothetical protein ScalyP_jg10402 [Parmales sp. scaly parma]|nr:hypothetical protein ScalyP_jg10402 [Parmales sp. scaly parma]
MIKIFQALSEKVSAIPFIYAGAHLGAILHAGLIPWDDDVDLAVDFKYKGALMSECEKFQHTNLDVQITCVERYNAVKLSVLAPEDDKMSFPHGKYISPYLDIYFISEDEHFVYELSPKGEKQHQRFKRNEFHPTRDFYFGGLTIAGPSEKLAKNRYDLSRCFLAGYNHRMEALFYKGSNPQERLEIDCCNLMDAGLPFVGVRGGEEVIVENAALGRENFRLPVQSDDVEYKGKRRSHKWCHKNDVQKFLASFVGLC